MSLPNPNWPS
uniref:Uncharacterized protein n=1 Tax=Anguilla anguilla TaxID=7936 RepID=A0A0E9XT78_ANGAN